MMERHLGRLIDNFWQISSGLLHKRMMDRCGLFDSLLSYRAGDFMTK